jgi:4-hydroxybutyrate dehydrogenase/sulfolactaldehyde 3-reductase
MRRGSDPELRVGLLGCGTVGRRIGSRLLERGRDVLVHDHTHSRADALVEHGASWVESPAELGESCDVLISALPGPPEVESALLDESGLWSHARSRTIHIEMSTVGLACIRRLGEAARERSLRLLDAPLSRGGSSEHGADLVVWVGGHMDHIELARPVLNDIADRVLPCGGLGQGQVTKLVNNLVSHVLTVVIGDALAMGVRAGGSLELLRAALHEGTAQSRLLDELLPPSVFHGDWTPGLRMTLAEKDLRLAAELAAETGVEIAVLEPVLAAYRRGIEKGWGDLSMYAVVRLAEEAAGVKLRWSG